MSGTTTHQSGGKIATPAPYFGALDGFRGLLALLVAVYHTPWESWFNNTAFMDQGTVLIDLFFVFSGFLMFHLYSDRIQTGMDARKFIWRRVARLYPIHFVMTMVFLAFALARLLSHKIGISVHEAGEILPFHAGAKESLWSLYTNLTLTQAMGTNDSLTFNPPAWTISVEFFAYFVFAAMLLWARPKRGWHFGLIAVAVVGLYAGLASMKPNMDITYDLAFWRCLAGFFTGVIAARIYGHMQARGSGISQLSGLRAHGLEIFTLSAYLLFTGFCGGKDQFFVGAVAFIFVLVFAHDRGVVSKIMMAPVFRYLAKISYSVYMIHVFVAICADVAAERIIGGWVGNPQWHDSAIWGDLYLLPYLIVVIGLSHLSVRYVEGPGARLIGSFAKRLHSKGAAPATV